MCELLPCPFCGGEAKLETYPGMPEYFAIVRCLACGSRSVKDTEAEAIMAWNTRVERTCQRVVYKPTGVLVCSECGAGIPKQLDKYCYLHYCPHCGAKVVD